MTIGKVFYSGLVGTTTMTAFSFATSVLQRKRFKEPELLGELLKNARLNNTHPTVFGWLLHYGMGIGWAGIEQFLLQHCRRQNELEKTLKIGTLSGLTAILLWKAIFHMHPCPPRTNFNRFYAHLFLAHLVYTFTVVKVSSTRKNGAKAKARKPISWPHQILLADIP